MKRLAFLSVVISILFIASSCKKEIKKISISEMPFNPYVEAFTNGNVSRFSQIYLIFNQDVTENMQDSKSLHKFLSISPEIKGNFSFKNSRTIVFTPTKEFARNTTYEVTADISKWFPDEEKKDNIFRFTFTTLPFQLNGELQSFDINPTNENNYDIVCVLRTPDKEKSAAVEDIITLSEKADLKWSHDSDGHVHKMTFTNISAGTNGSRSLKVGVKNNNYGLSEKDLLDIKIPDQNDFSLYDVKYVAEPERYIEATFTKTLDSSQRLDGLAVIENNNSRIINVEGNKLRLYPDAERQGDVRLTFDENIRAQNGLKLKNTLIKNVQLYNALPAVKFIGDGVILPISEKLEVPFQAIYLHGVVVNVIKILEQNIGQFLQMNNLDGSGDLMRVGRLISSKTIFFDGQLHDLTKWNTYAINIKELIDPEPGAIYRIELSFNKDLSAYPCKDAKPFSKEEIKSQDELRFQEQKARFDEGGYYYYDNNLDWSKYNYRERNNPCSDSYYFNVSTSKNILATNLGLMAFGGEDNRMIVLAHNIKTTLPQEGVSINAYNYQNQLIATSLTDSKGKAELDTKSGKPFYVIASQGSERSYLRVDNGSALSMSTFDVAGEKIQKGLRGFIYGDRGVWRPGDTLHLGFMLNDELKKLPANHPITMELYNPLGQLYLRSTQIKGIKGLYVFNMSTDINAPTGVWNVKVNVGAASFEKRIRIETIKPNRLKISLKMPERPILKGENFDIHLHAEWLQGAIAANLKYNLQATFIPVETTFTNYKEYNFNNPAKTFYSEESKPIFGVTDAKGNATINTKFEVGTAAPGMLMGNLVTRVYEESGEFSIDAVRHLYSPYNRYVGIISPQKNKDQLNTNQSYNYGVCAVDYTGKPIANADLEVNIYKVEWYWWWSSDQTQLANYISNSYNQPIKTLSLKTNANGKSSFDLKFSEDQWGTYFITVKDKEGKHSAGILNYYDWADGNSRRFAAGGSSAEILKFELDKDEYRLGEKMNITIPSAKGARAVVIVENSSKVLSVEEFECKDYYNKIKLDVTKEMIPNAYVYVALLQQHDQTINDRPIRMYGVKPFRVTSPQTHLNPVITVNSELKPDKPYTVTVSEKGKQEMAYTLAIVDEGLLDLTHFATPDPWATFNAREALGVNTWDLYNYVIGAYGGRIEQLFSIGGDDALNKGPKAIVNRFKPVVEFRGPFLLKPGEQQKHSFLMPNYNGRVRVMVVAGNGEAYGDTSKSVVVKQPVMVLGTFPRVAGVGDEVVIPATIFTTEKGVGNINVKISCSNDFDVIGQSSKNINIIEKKDTTIFFRIKVKDQPGVGAIKLIATGKNESSFYEADIPVQALTHSQLKVKALSLAAGNSIKENIDFFGMPGTNSLQMEISGVQPLNLTMRMDQLNVYPYDCVEQIVSKAFTQMYLPDFMTLSKEKDNGIQKNISDIIKRLGLYQTVDGAFAYWPGGSNINGWATAYATNFLIEAKNRGYYVQELMLQNALNYNRKMAIGWKNIKSVNIIPEQSLQAYRLYVLSLANDPEIGAMNRLKEVEDLSNIAKWILAGAYATSGHKKVAKEVISTTQSVNSSFSPEDYTFGSSLRNKAMQLIVLCDLDESGEASSLASEISKELSSDAWYNTQETAFGLISFAKYMNKYKVSKSLIFDYSIGNISEKVTSNKDFWSKNLLKNASENILFSVANKGKSTIFIRIISEGVPAKGDEKAYSNGLQMNISYTNQNGVNINPDMISQGTIFTQAVTIKNPTPNNYKYLVLNQYLPAGWEILNTRYMGSSSGNQIGVDYQDIRDDKVISYIDNLPAGRQITVKINLCAVYAGTFYMPSTMCELMYDNEIRANSTLRKVVVE